MMLHLITAMQDPFLPVYDFDELEPSTTPEVFVSPQAEYEPPPKVEKSTPWPWPISPATAKKWAAHFSAEAMKESIFANRFAGVAGDDCIKDSDVVFLDAVPANTTIDKIVIGGEMWTQNIRNQMLKNDRTGEEKSLLEVVRSAGSKKPKEPTKAEVDSAYNMLWPEDKPWVELGERRGLL